MRSQHWDTNDNRGQTKSTAMENSVKPLSQIDCLGLHRVDEDAFTREREAYMAKIRSRQRRYIKPESKESDFQFGRRKRRHLPAFTEGSYPALSQVPMGTNPILEAPHPANQSHHMYKRNANNTRLLPISQVSCLLDSPDGNMKKTPEQSASKFHIHDSDSTYVKLAKSGGHRGLLHYAEAEPPLRRSLDTTYSPSSNGTLPALKSKSVQDPAWKPSQWTVLSPIKKKEDSPALKDK